MSFDDIHKILSGIKGIAIDLGGLTLLIIFIKQLIDKELKK